MKSKFYLAFILAGIVPVVGLAAFYLYTVANGTSSTSQPAATTVPVNVPQQQSEVQTIASSLFNAIKTTNADSPNLTSHNGSADLQNFISTHTGVSGIVIVSAQGQAERTVPAAPALIDAAYSSNPEFANIVSKIKENPSGNYQFYTSRFGYPAFVFAVPLVKGAFAEVVLNISNFFKGSSSNGQYFILDANSGQFLYHSDPSKLGTLFNAQHETWLNTVQSDLTAQKSGISSSGNGFAAAYGYLGFGSFGVVHTFPLVITTAAPASNPASSDWSQLIISPMSLGFLLVFALLCFCAYVTFRTLISPFRRVTNVILAATEDSATLTPEIVKSFGNDEAGQIVQALALYHEKTRQDKASTVQNLNEQLDGLQRKSKQYQNEAQEKGQQLADKLRELEALKGMAEGLRGQSEQAKTENARLKDDLAQGQTALSEVQNKLTQLQNQLKAAEAKALQAAAAVSPVQVSQVRAAAIRTMSEELKNTLGIIKGYVSSVIGAGQGGVNEKQQEFLGMVINRSARLEKFINDLVDIYQVEIEQKDAKMEEVNLASEIETFAFNFQTQTELKNLKFKVEAKPGLPKVPVVRRRMTQLWNVLYLQLIKDSPKGSTIPIVVEPVGDSVKVTVQDPGLIVAPEALPRMFDEFYDPKHPASPQLAGTGLKLALVKTILTAHGGTAIAEKADPGTRLIFTFSTKRQTGTFGAAEVKTSAPAISKTPTAPVSSAVPSGTAPAGTLPTAKAPAAGLDLNAAFGITSPAAAPVVPGIKPPVPPASAPVPGITIGAKPPAVPAAPGSSAAPPPGLSMGSHPPAGSSTPSAPLPPIAGLTVGAKPPSGDGPVAGSNLPPLPPIPGLTVGAKPPSAGGPAAPPSVPGVPKPVPVPGILDALISGKIPSVTAPGIKPGAPPASVPPTPPKPSAPVPPPAGIPGAPKPPVAGSLDDLLKMKSPPPITPPPSAPPKAPTDDLLE